MLQIVIVVAAIIVTIYYHSFRKNFLIDTDSVYVEIVGYKLKTSHSRHIDNFNL
jgi:hypothetical protein